MGQRLKVAGIVPAGANETANTHQTAAAANIWLQAVEDAMLAAGFLRTSDTGQLASMTAAPVSGTTYGYRVYKLNDDQVNSSPVIVKLLFAGRFRRATNTTYRRLRAIIYIGTATDGAGNFVGDSISNVVNEESTISVTYNEFQEVISWRKEEITAVIIQPNYGFKAFSDAQGNYTATQSEFFLVIARLRDSEGNLDPAGFMAFTARPATVGDPGPVYGLNRPICARFYNGVVTRTDESSVRVKYPMLSLSADTSPIIQFGFTARTVDNLDYELPGMGFYTPLEVIPAGSNFTVAEAGGNKTYRAVGAVISPSTGVLPASVTDYNYTAAPFYTSQVYQMMRVDVGLCLDWDD